MKKMIQLLVCGMLMIGVGCTTMTPAQKGEQVYNAGYTAAIIYVEREKPTPIVKSNIVDTVEFIAANVSETNVVASYKKTLTPVVNNHIDKSDKISPANKPLVKIASVYVLSSVDGLLSQVNTTNVTSNIGFIYVKEFSTGFSDGIKATYTVPEISYIMKTGYKK
jgi:hypothetical protein